MLDQRFYCSVEGHADIHRGVAGAAQVAHLVAAVAGPDADLRRRSYDLAGPLVIQDMEAILLREGRLVHEDSAQLGFPAGEQGFDGILLDIEVLIVKFGHEFLVVTVSHAHHGELEKARHRVTRHRGRHAENQGTVGIFGIHHHPAGREALKAFAGFRFAGFPDRGRSGCGKRP